MKIFRKPYENIRKTNRFKTLEKTRLSLNILVKTIVFNEHPHKTFSIENPYITFGEPWETNMFIENPYKTFGNHLGSLKFLAKQKEKQMEHQYVH